MILVDKIKNLESDSERKKIIDKVLTHIQNNSLKSSNIEKIHMEAAVSVRNGKILNNKF